MQMFSGSYASDDVQFLLKQIEIEDTPVHLKEALIQSGKKHYSEMLSHESLPKPDYLDLFYDALALNQQQMAEHLLILAEKIINTRENITLVSLARAGTPIGVLLKRILKQYFTVDVPHYSVSIIRDIGLDTQALRFILKRHNPDSLVFIDGWTGKGIIAEQLTQSLNEFEKTDGIRIAAELYVLTDLSGSATVSASNKDYLIPSSVLNATVSGLISRSIYDASNGDDFHACKYYSEFIEQDLSNYFVDTILQAVANIKTLPEKPIIRFAYYLDKKNRSRYEFIRTVPLKSPLYLNNCQALKRISQTLIQRLMTEYNVSHPNYIKPGIGEATRVLLRREARCLLLRDLNTKATEHLCWLAGSKSIPIIVIADLPYQAVALIKEVL